MDQNRPPDDAARVKGSVIEAIGKLTGDARAQAEGAAEKGGGKAEKPAADAEATTPDATSSQT
jgi:uncharacterized protein YjbJ (UPF0337 family)